MIDKSKVKSLVDEWLDGKDYFFVDVDVDDQNKITVEILTIDGKKMTGVLKSADEAGFVVGVEEKQKIEGKKRPVLAEIDRPFKFDEVKWVKSIIDFK